MFVATASIPYQFDLSLTIFCPLQAPTSCSVSMSRSTGRTGGSNQGYSTTTGIGSYPMQRPTSSTMADVGSATHLSPSLSSYGIYASPSRGYPFPVMTHSHNACSLPMSRGASGSTSQYGLMEGAFENLNIAHETTHYVTPLSPFDAPIVRGRYARAQTPVAPPLPLSISRHVPVLSDISYLLSPSHETNTSVPLSACPSGLRSILKNSSRGEAPSPVAAPASIIFEPAPVLTAPSISKRATFSNDTTEIRPSRLVREESDIVYRSCRGRPPTPLPEMMENEGDLSD